MCPTNVAPPLCCQPPLTDAEWAEASRRLRAADAAVRARFPKFCPHCSDDSDLAPTFDGEVWMCGACCQPFEVMP